MGKASSAPGLRVEEFAHVFGFEVGQEDFRGAVFEHARFGDVDVGSFVRGKQDVVVSRVFVASKFIGVSAPPRWSLRPVAAWMVLKPSSPSSQCVGTGAGIPLRNSFTEKSPVSIKPPVVKSCSNAGSETSARKVRPFHVIVDPNASNISAASAAISSIMLTPDGVVSTTVTRLMFERKCGN